MEAGLPGLGAARGSPAGQGILFRQQRQGELLPGSATVAGEESSLSPLRYRSLRSPPKTAGNALGSGGWEYSSNRGRRENDLLPRVFIDRRYLQRPCIWCLSSLFLTYAEKPPGIFDRFVLTSRKVSIAHFLFFGFEFSSRTNSHLWTSFRDFVLVLVPKTLLWGGTP